jgi:hypothetical protein
MKNSYRVVSDNFEGFEAQVKYWWFPFIWIQIPRSIYNGNTHRTLGEAIEFIEECKRKNKTNYKVHYTDICGDKTYIFNKK